MNGSRIKGWWRAHHFISTACAGVLLIWPQGEPWQLFRQQFMYFNAYISMVQFLQFRYQRGVLYRLKALGERHDMDITIEGFHSWMWRGLTFLLPFLFAGYIFQAYNSYALYKLSYHPDAPWQVWCLSLLFFILFIGNAVTTLLVIPEKIRTRVKEHYRLMAISKQKKVGSLIQITKDKMTYTHVNVIHIERLLLLLFICICVQNGLFQVQIKLRLCTRPLSITLNMLRALKKTVKITLLISFSVFFFFTFSFFFLLQEG